jgi:squalene cyclase
MLLSELKAVLKSELNEGAIAGSDERIRDDHPDNEAFYNAMKIAIDEIIQKTEGAPLFTGLDEQCDDDDFSVYAYFVFVEME